MTQYYPGVDLSDLLCYSKGNNPPVMSSSPKYYPEKILGVTWYPSILHKYGLLKGIGEDIVEENFNVCFQMPDQNDKKRRYFASFNNYLDFLHLLKQIPMNHWYFFEIILGNQPQKLYFDIDIKISDLSPDIKSAAIFSQELINELVTRIVSIFAEYNYHLNVNKNILLFSSSDDRKISYHIIVDGYAVSNYQENYLLVSRILADLPENINNL